ncbi:MAG: GNAT family N-acetyltransferase [Oscillospiraceae bacterium]|nr:GNAT family N-acetyltransferase [Oscillospiraceae bacterium]
MILIKKLSVDFIEEIKTLFAEIFTNEPWNDDWSDENQLHNYILDLTGNRNSLAIGLFEDEKFIGMALGSIKHWYTGTEYYIDEFCIKSQKQGKGIGTKFLAMVEKFVEEKGISHIFLQTERTVPAFEFYKKNGFTELCDHVSFVKEFR